ncbi:MAG TPA: hypothetical protein VGM98_13700 [Schlesneria sp.]
MTKTLENQFQPEVPQYSELARRIDTLTFRQIADLRVEYSGFQVILRGRSKTYYAKQLATQAVQDLMPGAIVTNSVDVLR